MEDIEDIYGRYHLFSGNCTNITVNQPNQNGEKSLRFVLFHFEIFGLIRLSSCMEVFISCSEKGYRAGYTCLRVILATQLKHRT